MPLFLVDLDDTLIDRQAAFASWAKSFADSNGLADGSLAWLLEHDFGHGTATPEDFFNLVQSEHRLSFTRDELIARFLDEIVGHFSPVGPDTAAALRRLRSAGWKIAVVTNGSFSLQLRKLVWTGIIPLVDAWCISEEAGMRKPDAAIFQLAATRCGATLEGGWMTGDHVDADIAGGRSAGLRTAWVHRGRRWQANAFRPDLIVGNLAEAATEILLVDDRRPSYFPLKNDVPPSGF